MKTQFVRRRHELAAAIKFGIAVIPTAAERIRNKDAHFPYRFDSYFHYLTGFNEPESVVVVIGGKPSRSFLFCRAKHEEREIWDGFRYGPEEAKTQFNFDDTFAIDEIDKILPELIENKDAIFYPKAFKDESLSEFADIFNLIPVSEEDANKLACNAVVINDTVIFPSEAL